MPYSSMYQPMPLTDLSVPGIRPGFAVFVEDGWAGDAVALFDSARLTDVERDGVRPATRGRVQVDVVRDEEVARANGCGARSAGGR